MPPLAPNQVYEGHSSSNSGATVLPKGAMTREGYFVPFLSIFLNVK